MTLDDGATPAAASLDDTVSRRVLVTGAAGFIGRQCLPLLDRLGYQVHAVSSRAAPQSAGAVSWHRADLLEARDVDALCAAVGADLLLHLAWDTTPGAYTRTPLNLDWLAASLRLARRFVEHGGTRMVTAGTCFEYEHSEERCREDTTPIAPDTLYGTSKAALNAVLARYAAEAGIEAAWGRIFFLYGPHEHPDRLVASVVRALQDGREAACSVGTQVRDFLHVRDVARALTALLASDANGPVNIGSGTPVTIRELVLAIGKKTGSPDLIRFGARPPSPHDPPRILADVSRLRHEVGFEPSYTLEEGVLDTVRWWAREREPDSPTGSIQG